MTPLLILATMLAVPQKKSDEPPRLQAQPAECTCRLQELLDALAQQRRDEALRGEQRQRGDDAQAALAHVGG